MKHIDYKKLLRLSLFGELDAVEQKSLRSHLEGCDECKSELAEQKNLLSILSGNKAGFVDDNFLLQARAQLRGAIRNEREHRKPYEKLLSFFSELFPGRYRLVISGAAMMLVGFFSGYLLFNTQPINPVNQNSEGSPQTLLAQENIKISNINFIDADPSDGQVEFTFDATKPVTLKGRVDDPKIQSILTFSMLNEQNPGARLNSINAMDSGKPVQFDNDVRDALITVLITDSNPGVRWEALNLIRKFPFDEEIKQAYITVLTSDSSSSLKIEAINALVDAGKQGLLLNKEELNLFKQKLQTDDNPYVRYRTKTILQEYN